jgi:hypothetical protein
MEKLLILFRFHARTSRISWLGGPYKTPGFCRLIIAILLDMFYCTINSKFLAQNFLGNNSKLKKGIWQRLKQGICQNLNKGSGKAWAWKVCPAHALQTQQSGER